MSQPVITKDMDDVISSVRRLVAPVASPRPQSRDLGQDRLLLTPALRVVPLREAEAEGLTVDLPADQPGATPAATVAPESDAILHVVGDDQSAVESFAPPLLEVENPPAPIFEADDAADDDTVVLFPQGHELRAAAPDGREDAAVSHRMSDMTEAMPSLTDADGNPVTVIDEAALNDIVRALIREELQGMLGEKITQNVRKLVRAEINRALTARSLD